VDFQSELELVRKLRAAHALEKETGQEGEDASHQPAPAIQKAA
jgi:alpha-D-ribose 1-methylphosphonate 5-triphosphate synthase subunit PhnI